MNNNHKEICSKCDGKGYFTEIDILWDIYYELSVSCHVCEGTGHKESYLYGQRGIPGPRMIGPRSSSRREDSNP
jgi:hypothetical protein